MEVVVKIVLTVCLTGLAISILTLIRNEQVFKERMRVLGMINEKASEDIKNRLPWQWRYDALNETSYLEMLFKVWKPVKSFYKDHKCIK